MKTTSTNGISQSSTLQLALPGIVHYLIVDTQRRALIHHRREAGERIATHILKEGHLKLDPPGVVLNIGDLFIEEPVDKREA